MKYLKAVIVLRTALHLGTGDPDELTDSPVRRDAAGGIVIPATSLAGSLRNVCTRLAPWLSSGAPEGGRTGERQICLALDPAKELDKQPCGCLTCRLFGDINPVVSAGQSYQSSASRLWVYDLYPISPCPTAFRDSVGIDRVSGTAKDAAKFDLEMVPAGTEFLLRMKLETTTSLEEELLSAALGEWQAGRGSLGGGSSRGLGAFDFKDMEVREWNLDDPAELMSFLKSDDPWSGGHIIENWQPGLLEQARRRVTAAPSAGEGLARSFFSLEFTLRGEGPLLAGDAAAGMRFGFDHAPLLASLFSAAGPVLAGSGLRGVTRAQAEKILRTIASLKTRGKEGFLTSCPACDPLARNIAEPLACCDSLLEKHEEINGNDNKATEEQMCLSCRLFGSPRQGSRLVVEDAYLLPDERPVFKAIDFLAVDRFTGGGMEGAKFDALALWKPGFRVRMRLENPEEWELGLLTLALRDLEEGLLSVGFGSAKGFGLVKAGDWLVNAGFLLEEDLPALNGSRYTGPEENYSGIYRLLKMEGEKISSAGPWPEIAGGWIAALEREIQRFQRGEKLELAQDSYFGRPQEKLYPLEVPINA